MGERSGGGWDGREWGWDWDFGCMIWFGSWYVWMMGIEDGKRGFLIVLLWRLVFFSSWILFSFSFSFTFSSERTLWSFYIKSLTTRMNGFLFRLFELFVAFVGYGYIALYKWHIGGLKEFEGFLYRRGLNAERNEDFG